MKSHQNVIKQIIDYIENNLEEDINLDKIAGETGYSKFYLNRIFAEKTGCTIYKYLQSRRLTVAAEKLVNTKKSVIQIAYEAGYNSQQAFSLAFKQIYLCSPKVYRNTGVFTPRQNKLSLCLYLYPGWCQNNNRKAEVIAA